MRTPLIKTLRLLVLLSGLLTLDAAFAAAGKILFVSGSVTIERGITKAAAVGDIVDVGDVIVTGDKSRAQLLMGDGGKFAIRASSRFRIDAFALPPTVTAPKASATAADGLFAASLLKGGFRTMSGAVGKKDKNAYEVRTPIGTLGIRGTDYWALFCRGDCTNVPGVIVGQPVRDGLYLGVNDGSISFANGKIVLKAGEFIFIPLAKGEPEPLQTAPQFLLDDGAGPLQVNRGDNGKRAPLGAGISDFNERRDPPPDTTGAPGNAPPAGTAPGSAPQLPIGGKDANGRPVDLTGGVSPPPAQRNFAWDDATLGQNATAAVATTYVLDAGGNVNGFNSVIPPRAGPAVAATFTIGSAGNVDTGFDAATGLRWGRWDNDGVASYTAGGQPTPLPLIAKSLHWIIDSPFSLTPVLPVAGTASFALVGNTSPTDDQSHTGTLGSASFQADFTNRTVASAVVLDMAGVAWYGSGAGAITANTVRFAGTYTQGNIGGTVPTAGNFTGFFAVPAAAGTTTLGGALAYDLSEAQGLLGTVSGVAAFAQSANPTVVTPPPQLVRDVAFTPGDLGVLPTFTDVEPNAATDYVVNAGLNLTQYLGLDDNLALVQYDIGTATVAESGVDSLSLIRWGRWSGGTAQITGGSAPVPIDLTLKSLHWVMSGDGNAPVLPVGGVANYTLIGGTTPTNAAGVTGTLGNATLVANFGQQTVQSTLDITMPTGGWTANGNGGIGVTSGVAAHQFTGTYVSTFTPTAGGPVGGTGMFSGFFAGPPVGATGAPAGAGLTYSLQDNQGLNNVSGVAVLRGN